MPDKEKPAVATITAPAPAVGTATPPGTATPAGTAMPPVPPRRSPGHRGADVKDTVAEMAAKAHEISLEAGSKMAAAMKDVVGAAAGLTGLVLESARDLLQYMVRRGQMTQDEADKLMREVESSHSKKKPFVSPAASTSAGTKSAPTIGHTPHVAQKATSTQAKHAKPPAKHAKPPAKHAKPPAKHAKPQAKRSATAAKKPSTKRPTLKPAAKKHTTKSSSKSKPKASGKTAKRR